MEALGVTALVAAAFLAGAVPWGIVLGRGFGGVDLRRFGSGATGATNALRVLGWRISVAVFALDLLKGLLPVLAARSLGADRWVIAAVGVAAVAGHCWSPLIGFRGGKGVATGFGAAAGAVPWILLVVPLMVLVVAVTRYVSLGSLSSAAAVSVAVLVAGLVGELAWAAVLQVVVISAIIVVKHRENIRRLLAGTERRLGERGGPSPAGGAP